MTSAHPHSSARSQRRGAVGVNLVRRGGV